MTPSTCMKLEVQDREIYTDKKLMVLVIKNLVDNGIKYGTDNCVLLRTTYSKLEVISRGEALKHDLKYYTEPFSQEEKRSSGFGLGLYIVYSILQKLHYTLEYRHEDGKNIFMFELK